MAEPRDKAVVGIDPVAMKAMNDDLATVQAMIQAEIPKLRAAFGTAAVDTGPADRLTAIGQWIQAELPMLRRRQAYAAQLQQINLQETGTELSLIHTEWPGNFPSAEAAVAKGKELAGKYTGDGKLPPEVWDELAKNSDDPDFAAAFAQALGAKASGRLIYQFTVQSKTGKFGAAEADQRSVLANLLATASHRGVIDESWFEKSSLEGGVLDLMDTGQWDSSVLIKAGNFVLRSPNPDADSAAKTAKVLAGLARVPTAATQVYSDNFDRVQQLTRGETTGWTTSDISALGDPLGAFVQAATVTARHVYDQGRPAGAATWSNPAEDLTRRLLMDLQKNQTRPPWHQVQDAYAAITVEYFDDLLAATGGPPVPEYFNQPDLNRRGIEAPADAWAHLIQYAMWDPKNAAAIVAFAGAKHHQAFAAAVAAEPEHAPLSNDYTVFQATRMERWFAAQLDAVRKASGEETAAYNARMSELVDKILDPTKAAVFAAGGGWGAAATAARQTAAGVLKATAVAEVKEKILEWLKEDPKVFPTHDQAIDDAYHYRLSAEGRRAGHLIKPVKDLQGRIWTGQPAYYEKLYGAKFTDEHGLTVASSEKVAEMSPAAQRAYAAWLRDPAVQQAACGDFNMYLASSGGS